MGRLWWKPSGLGEELKWKVFLRLGLNSIAMDGLSYSVLHILCEVILWGCFGLFPFG